MKVNERGGTKKWNIKFELVLFKCTHVNRIRELGWFAYYMLHVTVSTSGSVKWFFQSLKQEQGIPKSICHASIFFFVDG